MQPTEPHITRSNPRHREERSDVAIQGRRTGPNALDRHAAKRRLAMTVQQP
ncbi:MAG: hypothetical protein JO264_11965 [Acidisphaera sp.]|nr:hypothetical protein [Acidisphaera sp.]